jgi:CRISPR-associated exonuclease Cas4
MHITGNLVNAYYTCKRKFWLYARQFNPDPETALLQLGKIISQESYKREKKEILLEGMKIDLVKKEEEQIIVCEVKKSSKGLKAAIMQLSFYLKKLKEYGLYLKGEILIPRERKRLPVELSEELEKELDNGISDMKRIMFSELPPNPRKTSFCRKCSFFEFCWA